MANTFGADGFICSMQETEGGFLLSVYHPRYANEVKIEKNIKNSDVEGGVRPDDRSQTDKLFAPLLDEAKAKYDERAAEADKRKAADRHDAQKRALKESSKKRDESGEPVAEDGTVGSTAV